MNTRRERRTDLFEDMPSRVDNPGGGHGLRRMR